MVINEDEVYGGGAEHASARGSAGSVKRMTVKLRDTTGRREDYGGCDFTTARAQLLRPWRGEGEREEKGGK